MVFTADYVNFFPGIRFWSRTLHADFCILVDDFQFVHKRNSNRCKIKTAVGPAWLTIPVLTKGMPSQLLKDVKINNQLNWGEKIWRTIVVNYKQAAYFEMFDLELEALFRKKWVFLIDINLACLQLISTALKIPCQYYRSSSTPDSAPRDFKSVLQLGKKVGGTTYLAEELYQRQALGDIVPQDLRFKQFGLQPFVYYQQFDTFTPELSILDLVMNEGKEAAGLLRTASFFGHDLIR